MHINEYIQRINKILSEQYSGGRLGSLPGYIGKAAPKKKKSMTVKQLKAYISERKHKLTRPVRVTGLKKKDLLLLYQEIRAILGNYAKHNNPAAFARNLQIKRAPLDAEWANVLKKLNSTFRKAALKHHPDKGGNNEDFHRITAAHEELVESEKMRVYGDLYGHIMQADEYDDEDDEDEYN